MNLYSWILKGNNFTANTYNRSNSKQCFYSAIKWQLAVSVFFFWGILMHSFRNNHIQLLPGPSSGVGLVLQLCCCCKMILPALTKIIRIWHGWDSRLHIQSSMYLTEGNESVCMQGSTQSRVYTCVHTFINTPINTQCIHKHLWSVRCNSSSEMRSTLKNGFLWCVPPA